MELPEYQYYMWGEHSEPNIWFVARSRGLEYPFECYVFNPVPQMPFLGWNNMQESLRYGNGERCHVRISGTEALLIIIGGREIYLQTFKKFKDKWNQDALQSV
jgi:hypothetical protein